MPEEKLIKTMDTAHVTGTASSEFADAIDETIKDCSTDGYQAVDIKYSTCYNHLTRDIEYSALIIFEHYN